MSKLNISEILAEVKENSARLSACKNHNFSIPLDRRTLEPIEKPQLFQHWRCSQCGGHVDNSAKKWYESGKLHAKSE